MDLWSDYQYIPQDYLIMGLLLYILWTSFPRTIWGRTVRNLQQEIIRSAQTRKLVLKLATHPEKDHRFDSQADYFYRPLAMVAAMQGHDRLLFSLLRCGRATLNLHRLLKAAFAIDAHCWVGRELVGNGILTPVSCQQLTWTKPSPDRKAKVAKVILDHFLEQVWQEADPARAIKELCEYCEGRDFSPALVYLQSLQLTW